jgi:hypothetical protein
MPGSKETPGLVVGGGPGRRGREISEEESDFCAGRYRQGHEVCPASITLSIRQA